MSQFGHQTLSTYGIGKDYSKKQWQPLSRQFLHKGLMLQDMEFGSLKLTDYGWTVLRGDETVLGYLDQEPDAAPFVDEPVHADDLTCDDRLFETLRGKRQELADEAGVPPYAIFSDKTLIEMAVFFPNPVTVCLISTVSARLNARNSENCFSILFVLGKLGKNPFYHLCGNDPSGIWVH